MNMMNPDNSPLQIQLKQDDGKPLADNSADISLMDKAEVAAPD